MKEKQEKLKSPKNDPDEQANVATPNYKVWLEIEKYDEMEDQVFVEFVSASSAAEAAIAASKRLTSDTISTEPDDDEELRLGVRRLTSAITSVSNEAPNKKSTGSTCDSLLLSRLATLRRIHNG